MLTESQLEIRKTGLGGSDAPIVAGLSPWKSPLDLYLEKIGQSDSDDVKNERIYFGNILEPIIRSEYVKRTGNQVTVTDETFRHKDYPWMIAHVDGLIQGDNAILECKTASAFVSKKWGIPGTDEIPEYYLLQCAHYAAVCDVDRVDIAVLIDNSDFRIYHYDRNKKLETNLIGIEEYFWTQNVLKHAPPEPTRIEDFDKLFGCPDKGSAVMADENLINAVHDVNIIKDKIRQLEQQKNSFESKIKCSMGKCDTLIDQYSGRKIATWKEVNTTRIDTKALQLDNPELIEQYKTLRTSRVFRLSGEA